MIPPSAIVMRQLYLRYGLSTPPPAPPSDLGPGWRRFASAIASLYFLVACLEVTDAEHDELGGLDHRQAHFDHQLACLDDLRRIGFFVAFDEIRFFRGASHQGATLVHPLQEAADSDPDAAPQQLIVGLEHGPQRAALDRALDHGERAPHVDVAPPRL